MKSLKVSLFYGFIFVAIWLLVYTTSGLVRDNGFFDLNAIHNLVHILAISVLLFGIFRFPVYEASIIKFVGVAYAAVSILGFLTSGNTLLGIVHINEVDRWLHLILAITILAAGFSFSDNQSTLDAHSVDIR